MGGKSGGDTEVKQEPWKPQKQALKNVFGEARDVYNQGSASYFPGQTYADMDPRQLAGLQSMEQYGTQQMPGLASDSTGAYRGMLTAPDVENNPYVQDWAQAANRRLATDFNEQIMPGLRQHSSGMGGPSSRTDLASGIAAGKVAQAMGDQTANMYSQAYGQGLDQQARGLAMAPQTMNLGLMPGQTQFDVGGKYQGQDQLGINEAMQRHFYDQDADWNNLNKYNAIISGGNWGGTSTSPNAQSSPLSGALGGAALGGGLASWAFPAAEGATGMAALGPYGIPAALGGALLGGLLK